tara:strand:- start:1372 stop:1860 length:489 start_codon:yes stop_codon:yes gene_type:complete
MENIITKDNMTKNNIPVIVSTHTAINSIVELLHSVTNMNIKKATFAMNAITNSLLIVSNVKSNISHYLLYLHKIANDVFYNLINIIYIVNKPTFNNFIYYAIFMHTTIIIAAKNIINIIIFFYDNAFDRIKMIYLYNTIITYNSDAIRYCQNFIHDPKTQKK